MKTAVVVGTDKRKLDRWFQLLFRKDFAVFLVPILYLSSSEIYWFWYERETKYKTFACLEK